MIDETSNGEDNKCEAEHNGRDYDKDNNMIEIIPHLFASEALPSWLMI